MVSVARCPGDEAVHVSSRRITLRLAALLALTIIAACSRRDRQDSAEDSADAARLPIAAALLDWPGYVRGCPVPTAPFERAVFDVHVRGRGPDARDRLDAAARAIERLGGRVIHRFHVSVIRADLDTSAVRALVYGPDSVADRAEQVADSARRDLTLDLIYDRRIAPADSQLVADFGEVVGAVQRRRDMITATLPDSVLPVLARTAGIREMRTRALGCGTPG